MKEIKKENFRIGNLINYINSEGVKQDVIHCLNYTTLTVGDAFNRETIKYRSILPIPLTDEWLIKFGFEKRIGRFIGNRFTIGLNTRTLDFILSIEQTDEKKQHFFYLNSFHKIEYVHTLQNLYFILTSEELKIKP